MKGKFTKKAGALFMSAVMTLGCAAAVLPQVTQTGIEAQAANSDRDFDWSDEYNGGYVVTKYIGTSTNVIIPSSHKGKPVIEIGSEAFEDNKRITSVVIPSTVKTIGFLGGEVFMNCSSLKSITIPDSVEYIGMSSFENCTSLESVTLPKETDRSEFDQRFGQNLFKGCKSLKKINFQNWTSIPSGMFEGCSFTSFTVPNTIKEICDGAFQGCSRLVSVSIPDSVKTIGDDIFADCTSLKTIRLSNSIESIKTCCFKNCTSLEEIIIPGSVKRIGVSSFENCKNLKKIIIPKSVEDINNTAFANAFTSDSSTPSLVIYGEKNSYAERYAKQHKIPFKVFVEATSIVMNSSKISLDIKKTYQLIATINPSNTTINTVTWKSSNTKVATVTSAGKVTAVNSGTATITATTSNGKTAKCSVTVYGSPASIKLSSSQMSLGKGEATKLTATVGPQYAKNKTVKWRTSNSKILTVDQKGNVKAVGIGTAWITARTVNGLEKSCKITVKNAPSSVKLSSSALTLGVGETYSLSAVLPANTAAASRTFRTSNSSVVKMTKTNWEGQFKAMKTGTAYVTVRLYNGKEASCKITVKKAPTWISLNKTNIKMKVGQTASVSAYIASDAGCATRKYRTSNSSIVKMTKTNWTGEFKAMKKGVAWVTVRTYNGKEKSCKITVV